MVVGSQQPLSWITNSDLRYESLKQACFITRRLCTCSTTLLADTLVHILVCTWITFWARRLSQLLLRMSRVGFFVIIRNNLKLMSRRLLIYIAITVVVSFSTLEQEKKQSYFLPLCIYNHLKEYEIFIYSDILNAKYYYFPLIYFDSIIKIFWNKSGIHHKNKVHIN